MILNHDGTKPIYIQIAQWLENEILNGHFHQDDKVYSQYQLAEMFTINPATAAKGLNLLVDQGILYKKRGLGMFVSGEGTEVVMQNRREGRLKEIIEELILETKRLRISEEEMMNLIQSAWKGERGE